jgi:hypothetical protein
MSFLFFVNFASAQNLSNTIGTVGSQYAKSYLAPAADAFGADLNSGLFHTASVGGMLPFGLTLYIGVKVGAAIIPSSEKSFNLAYPDTVSLTQAGQTFRVPTTFTVNNAPTIFGSKTAGYAKFSIDTTISGQHLVESDSIKTIGGLLHTSIAPIPIPQIGLGSLFGTDAFIRFLPKIKISSYGSLQLFGWGLRHEISQYIPLIPIDIAVQIGFQNFSIKDSTGSNLLKSSAFAANVEVSKTLAILTLYGGLQVESSKVDVSYTYLPEASQYNLNPQPIPISFSMNGKDKFRAIVGFNLGLGPLLINADYSIASISVVSAGIGFSI